MAKKHSIFAPKNLFTRKAAAPLFLVFILFYLCFHTVSGERGVFALMKATHELEILNAQLAEVTAKRQNMESRVKLISSNSLDLDMLDERARVMLGYMGKDERVIFLPED